MDDTDLWLLWCISIVPFLALVVAIDGTMNFSKSLARAIRLNSAEPVLLILIIVAVVVYFKVAGASGAFDKPPAPITDYAEVPEVSNDPSPGQWYAFSALAALVISPGFGVWLAVRRRRPVWVWLPITIVANIGALVWLYRLPRPADRAVLHRS